MTQAKAAAVVAAIVGAGYECRAVKVAENDWKVRSASANIDVNVVAIVAPFAVSQSITALVAEVEYS